MSRRYNATNRAGTMVNGSKYTGYAKPKKKAVSLAELNGLLNKNIQSNYKTILGGLQDER